MPVDTHAIPVKLGGRVIAVVEQHTSLLGVRAPSSLGAGVPRHRRRSWPG